MINFIQIGANIGNTESDIIWKIVRENNWNGIFVEPLAKSFEKLKENYSDLKDSFFEKVAIYNYDGEIDLYFEDKYNSETASLIQSHCSDRNTCIERVLCIKLETLIKKYNLYDVSFDLLQIDVEKADGVILLDTDFTHILPKHIRFEHCHISSDDRWDILKHLSKFGYKEIPDMYNDLRQKQENNIDTMVERQ